MIPRTLVVEVALMEWVITSRHHRSSRGYDLHHLKVHVSLSSQPHFHQCQSTYLTYSTQDMGAPGPTVVVDQYIYK